MEAKNKKLLAELLTICGFDVDQEDLPLKKSQFVSYGCKNRAMVNEDWDDDEEFEEAKQRMKAEVEESLVDMVMYHDASFFVFSNNLNILAAVREALEAAISAQSGRHAGGDGYVARMEERGRFEERLL